MAFDYIYIKCVLCKGQNNTSCSGCKGKGKRRVDINYHPISQKPFTDEEYELIITCMKQMFNTSRGENEGEGESEGEKGNRNGHLKEEETLPPPSSASGFKSYRVKKAE
jgi:hypothetical protein